ncbi:alpha/beta hydrolase [Pseudomonas sp. CR3202]|uniref:alpha/beta hydrolase n=1 Tax=Pseudomonas sp. CR3202 TaxID=3351532 RepID=UPI003BF0E5B1
MNLQKSLIAAVLGLAGGVAFAAGSPGVEQDTQRFLDALEAAGGKPLEQMTAQEARSVLVGAQASVKVDLSGIRTEEKTIQAGGQPIKLTIVRPDGAGGSLPVFMFFHGGGWVLGDYPTHSRLIRDLVVNSGAVAVYVDYTRSPEAQYPTAINQAYAATQWVATHGDEIGVDSSRLAVAGNSVGGNMAAVVSLMAKEQGAPKIRFQLLLWPVTDANLETPSYNQFAQGHFLTKPLMKWFWNSYTTDQKQRAQIDASPLRASLEQLQGLPPALIQTAEFDVLRDEGEAYARRLDAAGVAVTATRYNGMIHDFGLLNPLAHINATQSAMLQAGVELKKNLR